MNSGVLNLKWENNKWTFKTIYSFFVIINNRSSLYFGTRYNEYLISNKYPLIYHYPTNTFAYWNK
jgi:hypothetical protein